MVRNDRVDDDRAEHDGTEDKVLGADGQFHAQDEAVDLRDTTFEGWVALGLFWLLGLTVLHQFVTRYILNDSAAWTEEIARYLLVAVVFVGAAIGVRKNNHIQVDYFYRHLPPLVQRVLSIAVDVTRTAFYVGAVIMTAQLMLKIGGTTRMTVVDLPMNLLYAFVLFGFAAMLVRSLQVSVIHWRRGYSVLERPESAITDR